MLMYSVSIGVATGISLGIKLIFSIDLATLLLPLYAIGLILTFFSSEEFVNVGWDMTNWTCYSSSCSCNGIRSKPE